MRGVLYVLPIGLIAVGTLLLPARAQGKGARAAEIHLGAGSCAAQACHGGGVEERKEYKLWATEDRHHKAYDVLAEPLGRRIGERLGIDPEKDESCLVCHATTGVRLAKTHVIEDGVSCELCHGGAKEWLGPHATPEWKALTAGQKAERGLRDLSTPEARVEACVGCHVGGRGSDITHEVMAAGHPPLIFDAAAYLRAMPPHWKDEEDLTLATWVAGLRANALAQLNRIERSTRKDGFEFAIFDCFSCHHQIYSGSVYERQATPGKPGDLPVDLTALKVLTIVDPRIRIDAELTFPPREDPARLAAKAQSLIEQVQAVSTLPTKRGRYLENLDAYLLRVAEGTARAPRAEMRTLAMAVSSLTGRKLGAEIDAAMALGAPYDAPSTAKLVRALLH